MPWAGTCSYSQTTPPMFFLLETHRSHWSGRCSHLLTQVEWPAPSGASFFSSFHIEWLPAQRPLWTFKEAQRKEQKETELRIKSRWIPGGVEEEGPWAAESLHWKPPVDSVPDDPTGLTGIRWDGEREEMERCVWTRTVWKWAFTFKCLSVDALMFLSLGPLFYSVGQNYRP